MTVGRRAHGFDLLLGLLTVWLASLAKPSSGSLATLLVFAAVVVLWPASGRGASERASERHRTRLIVCLALVSTTLATGAHLAEFATSWKVRVWNVYHYYLGAKYFPELGYTDLYDATLSVDHEGERYWRNISRVRNLRTYQVENRLYRLRAYQGRDAFEPERWQSFAADVEALSGQRRPRSWQGIFTDRGYNGTPLWTVLGGALADLVPADHRFGLKLLCGLDLLLFAATFGLILRTFGLRPAALVLLLLTATPVNAGRFVGGFLQYDWFCAVAAGICFYRRGRDAAAAGVMAYAVMTRVFPLFFVVAGAIPPFAHWWRTGRRPRRQSRFLATFALWCMVAFAISLWNGRGLGGWSEFATGISLHREHHLFGQRRIGLRHLFTQDLGRLVPRRAIGATDSRTPLARLRRDEAPLARLRRDEAPLARLRRDADRRLIYHRQRRLFALTAGVLLVLFLVAAGRRRSWDAQLLGLVPIFVLIVTSRYYLSYLALLPLISGRRGPPERRSRWLTAGQLVVLAAFYGYDSRGVDAHAAYGFFNALLAGFFVFLLATCLRRSVERASRSG